MHRYLAISVHVKNAAAVRAATRIATRFRQLHASDWACEFSTSDLIVFGERPRESASRAYLLPNESGILLGRVFSSGRGAISETAHEFVATDALAHDIIASRGRRLLEESWGNYIAFLRDPSDGTRCVIRDCSGKIPCYRTRFEHVDLFFSDVMDLEDLPLGPFTVNWAYLSAFLFFNDLQIRQSGLNEVTELLAGDCVISGSHGEQHSSLWDPAKICRGDPVDHLEEAKTLLKQTTETCVSTWAEVHRDILLTLSGGFDSSVVLGCLSRLTARPNVTCLNRFNTLAGEDEREFARKSAALAGVTLVEHPWTDDPASFDARLLDAPRTAKPSVASLINFPDLRFRNEIARRVGAIATWTGQGGDHLFFQMTTDLAAADYFRAHGIGIRFLRTVDEAARFSRNSYLAVLRTAWHSSRTDAPWRPDFMVERKPFFVKRASLPGDLLAYVATPWVPNAADLPKGKQCQLHFLAEVLNRHRPTPRLEHAAEHHPLISQPLIELSLRIPLYLLLKGGRHRALAREVFADRVPAEIIARESKGGSTSSAVKGLRGNKEFVRDMLLDGRLVQEGILDREAMLPYLDHGQPMRVDQFFPLFACLAAEIWLRQWENVADRSAVSAQTG